jgi:hypothetical protein
VDSPYYLSQLLHRDGDYRDWRVNVTLTINWNCMAGTIYLKFGTSSIAASSKYFSGCDDDGHANNVHRRARMLAHSIHPER